MIRRRRKSSGAHGRNSPPPVVGAAAGVVDLALEPGPNSVAPAAPGTRRAASSASAASTLRSSSPRLLDFFFLGGGASGRSGSRMSSSPAGGDGGGPSALWASRGAGGRGVLVGHQSSARGRRPRCPTVRHAAASLAAPGAEQRRAAGGDLVAGRRAVGDRRDEVGDAVDEPEQVVAGAVVEQRRQQTATPSTVARISFSSAQHAGSSRMSRRAPRAAPLMRARRGRRGRG